MLVIREEQVDIFRRVLLDTLNTRLLHFLRAASDYAAPPDAQMTLLISRGLADARRFRLLRETDLFTFIGIFADFCGQDVQRILPVQTLQILLRYGVDPGVKLEEFKCWVAASMTPVDEIL